MKNQSNLMQKQANKKNVITIIIIIALIIILAAIISYIVLIKIKPLNVEIFTPEQAAKLQSAAGEYSDSGGRLANGLIEFFKTNNLEISLKVCEQTRIMEKTSCYRLLAISRPDDKEVVCQKIQDSEQKETCLMAIPFLM